MPKAPQPNPITDGATRALATKIAKFVEAEPLSRELQLFALVEALAMHIVARFSPSVG